jgi:GNAT superfamily N-acetyltransferase
MNDLAISVRPAKARDAGEVARVYIDSWHDTYPAILPTNLLCAMTPKGQAARWHAAICMAGRESVLVAETPDYGVMGMASMGPARDGTLGFDGEIYTIYVDPSFYGQGAGRLLLRAGFERLRDHRFNSCLIWAHAKNPARFFYEAMGGRVVAERQASVMGEMVPETGFGWPELALCERAMRGAAQ